MIQSISFLRKFILCFVLSLLFSDAILLLGTDTGRWLNSSIIFSIAVIFFAAPYVGLLIWQYRERKKKVDAKVYNSMQIWVANVTGFCIMIFGWKKILGLQFRTPLSIADLPMSSQPGEVLTWYYFSHSQTFGFIIGFIQIAGSFLLFFRRTRLAALFLLLPVMLNVACINIFYQMNTGALLQSIILTTGLLYLIFQYREQLTTFLFKKNDAPSKQTLMQWIIACSFLVVAFVYTFLSRMMMPAESSLFGKYNVQEFVVNGKNMQLQPNKDSILTKVYFDVNNVCVLEYNDVNKRMIANYVYDNKKKTVESHFTGDNNSKYLHLKLNEINKQTVTLNGSLGNDRVQLVLNKL